MIFLYHLEECVLCFLCPQARCCWVFGVVAEAPIQIQSQRSFGTKANSLRLHSLGSQMNGKDPHSPHHEDRTVPEWKSGPHSREATTANSFARWYQIVDLNGKNFMLGYQNLSIGWGGVPISSGFFETMAAIHFWIARILRWLVVSSGEL